MYAAGHPPLKSVELASFGDRMPRHWRLLPRCAVLAKISRGRSPEPNAGRYRKCSISTIFARADSRPVPASAGDEPRLPASGDGPALPSVRRLPQEGAADQKRRARWPELTLKAFAEYKDDLPSLWPQLAMAQADSPRLPPRIAPARPCAGTRLHRPARPSAAPRGLPR